jgi:hypothetical protein
MKLNAPKGVGDPGIAGVTIAGRDRSEWPQSPFFCSGKGLSIVLRSSQAGRSG